MSGLCQYSEIFGKVGEGVHSYRVFDIAIVDVVLTFVLAKILEMYVFSGVDYWKIVIGCFVSGIILHHLFCVRTTVDKLIFG